MTLMKKRMPSLLTLMLSLCLALNGCSDAKTNKEKASSPAAQAKTTLTVSTTQAKLETWPHTLSANGDIAAWQEAVIGSEAAGLRITHVNASIGDRVKRGQVLVKMDASSVQADLAATQAALSEAKASLLEAQANAKRARELKDSGAISAQQIHQYLTAENTAEARVQAQRARLKAEQLRLRQTQLLAPDDGVISARTATVGAVIGAGQEMFRMIRQGRLEWRAELPASDLAQIQPGQIAHVGLDDAHQVQGKVRQIAPTVNPGTRNGLVYIDLDGSNPAVRAGIFARGTIDIGSASALTLPQSAILLRDGHRYVWRLDDQNQVTQTQISVGRRSGDRIEITAGLTPDTNVVADGVGFLSDGDHVRVVR
jgi:RND family efflux transporter MFP subunit